MNWLERERVLLHWRSLSQSWTTTFPVHYSEDSSHVWAWSDDCWRPLQLCNSMHSEKSLEVVHPENSFMVIDSITMEWIKVYLLRLRGEGKILWVLGMFYRDNFICSLFHSWFMLYSMENCGVTHYVLCPIVLGTKEYPRNTQEG